MRGAALLVAALLLAAPAAARKQNRASRQVNNRRRECERSEKCVAEHEDWRHNCVLHCQSPACYEEVYGVEVAASDDVTARGDGRCCGVARPADMVLETDNVDAGSVYFTDGIKSWEGRLKGGCHMGCWLCLRAVICPKSPTDRAFRWCVGVVVGVILLMVLLAELGLLKIYCPKGMTVANGEDGD